MTYKVLVDDNFHYMDESERYAAGEFTTLDEALEACRKIVDDYLLSVHKPGMTAESLFESYTSFGDDPFIIAAAPEETGVKFSAWDYARRRCDQLCVPVQGRDKED